MVEPTPQPEKYAKVKMGLPSPTFRGEHLQKSLKPTTRRWIGMSQRIFPDGLMDPPAHDFVTCFPGTLKACNLLMSKSARKA